MITGIHHINFLVRDLPTAVEKYCGLLGREPVYESLPGRGVETARFEVGESWVVLIQPVGEEGVPAEYLREHGEGFFLISYRTEDLGTCLDELETRGMARPQGMIRQGISNWRVVDVDESAGVISQIAEERPPPSADSS